MATVIGVRFKNAGKLYYFSPGALWPTAGDGVIVETARGVEYGEVVTGVREIEDSQLLNPLKPVIRIADAQDAEHLHENERREREAFTLCQQKISEHRLDMKLVGVEYTFDNAKILFYFTANGRVDFRALVKDLAGLFKTRIELRQIGVRDEAKMMGGLGPCGRAICCASFLGDFQPVSIKMAKEQNLSLNPTKISGVCGRLMCCLKYEQDTYEQVRRSMPKVGKEVMTPDGPGFVLDVNVLKETVHVRVSKGDTGEVKDYPAADVARMIGGKPVPRTAEEESESDESVSAAALGDDVESVIDSPAQPDMPETGATERRTTTTPKPFAPARPKPPRTPAPATPSGEDKAALKPNGRVKPAPTASSAWPTPDELNAKMNEASKRRVVTAEVTGVNTKNDASRPKDTVDQSKKSRAPQPVLVADEAETAGSATEEQALINAVDHRVPSPAVTAKTEPDTSVPAVPSKLDEALPSGD